MDQSLDSSVAPTSNDENTTFDDGTDLNTAELSDISGLSKVLRADDSIADRVRFLLDSDEEDKTLEKPELLDSAKEDPPSYDELAAKIATLLEDSGPETSPTKNQDEVVNADDKNGSNLQNHASRNDVDAEHNDTAENPSAKSSLSFQVTPADSPIVTTIGRRSGDGADNEPATIAAESSDDIMNVSDATEYSDLPKVIDNPIKKVRNCLKSSSRLALSTEAEKSSVTSKSLNEGSVAKIDEEPDLLTNSGPNSLSNSLGRARLSGGDSVVAKSESEASDNVEEDGFHTLKPSSGIQAHSTPQAHSDSSTVKPSDLSRTSCFMGHDDNKRRSPEANITMRSKEDDNIRETSRRSSQRTPDPTIPESLTDEKLFARIRQAVNGSPGPTSALKGPHTSSEQSIASSVDSLGLKVRNLLKSGNPVNAPESNRNNESTASNFSEEISNFERTDLWKYTRQFLPGTLTPSRDIQPLARFTRTSPMAVKDTTSDSSAASSPVTYRLAREVITPVNDPGQSGVSGKPSSLSNNSSKQSTIPIFSHVRDVPDSRNSRRTNSFQTRSLSDGKPSIDNSRSYGNYPKPPTYSSLGSSQVKNSELTPQNESYKALQPHYSETPYTPFSFVTPRRVAWEAERDVSAIKGRSSYGRDYTELASSSTADKPSSSILRRGTPVGKSSPEERSAYFNQARFADLQKSPKPMQRSSAISFKRLDPDLTSSYRRQNLSQEDKTTSTREHSIDQPDEHIFVKPVTPPSLRSKNRDDSPVHLRRTSSDRPTTSSPPKRSSPKTVTFRKSPSPYVLRTNLEKQGSASLPEYSFTTPKVFERPKKNITPKVQKEHPRQTLSLPTYDQLVAEQELLMILPSPIQRNLPAKSKSPVLKILDEHTSEKFNGGIDSIGKDFTTESSRNDPKLCGRRTPDAEFSALQPEVCLNDSVCDGEDVATTPPKFGKERQVDSDNSSYNLHKRTAASCDSDIDALSSCNPQTTAESESPASGEEPIDSNKRQVQPKSPRSPNTPAPLPYVRLTKKKPITPFRKNHIPPRHSISTEKVQTLLMKEKPVPHSRTVTSASFPPANGDYSSSSDEDLLHLMETVATKVPLMHKLMKKLYERSLEKQMSFETQKEESEPEAETVKKNVNRSVQTSTTPIRETDFSADTACKSPVCEKKTRPKNNLAESACQTSFTKPKKRILVAHKGTSPVEELQRDSDGIKNFDSSSTPGPSSLATKDTCDKENCMKKTRPCAFFVDMTPDKTQKPVKRKENDEKPPPLAWYEPYEYVPLWKQRDEESTRKTLGFVDANIQDAFLNKKRDFVLRSWERQEDIAIRAEERRLKDLEYQIQDQIQALRKEKAFKNAVANKPNLKEKKDRNFGWKEMKLASKQKYDTLPEVVAKKREAERKKYYEANRKRAEIYKRKITQMIVQKQRGKLAEEIR